MWFLLVEQTPVDKRLFRTVIIYYHTILVVCLSNSAGGSATTLSKELVAIMRTSYVLSYFVPSYRRWFWTHVVVKTKEIGVRNIFFIPIALLLNYVIILVLHKNSAVSSWHEIAIQDYSFAY
jgi:hypothetical protein